MSAKLYEDDGDAEEGYFMNTNGYKLHTYIWYPENCRETREGSHSSACAAANNSPPSFSEPSSPDSVCTGATLETCLPPFNFSSNLNAHTSKNIKGIVLLLHGYESHSRFSWFAKPLPEAYAFQDPTVPVFFNKKYLSTDHDNKNKDSSNAGKTDENTHNEDTSSPTSLSNAAATEKKEVKKLTLKYEDSWVQRMTKDNYIVAAFDFQSHGLSEGVAGKRCAVENLDDLAVDALQFLYYVNHKFNDKQEEAEEKKKEAEKEKKEEGEKKEEEKKDGKEEEKQEEKKSNNNIKKNDIQLPIIVCGSSLGGWTAARLLQLFTAYPSSRFSSSPSALPPPHSSPLCTELRLKGVILVAPMLCLSEMKNKIRYSYTKPVVSFIARMFPYMHLSAKKPNEIHPHMEEYLLSDPLTYKGGVRACCVRELLHATDVIHKPENMNKIHEEFCQSILLIHNFLDGLCEIEGCFKFFNNLKNIQDKTIVPINVKLKDNFLQEQIKKIKEKQKEEEEKQDKKEEKNNKGDALEEKKEEKIKKEAEEEEKYVTQEEDNKSTKVIELEEKEEEETEDGGKIVKVEEREKEGGRTVKVEDYNIYYKKHIKHDSLRQQLLQYAEECLQGLDVNHSLATEPHNPIIINKVMQWINEK